MALNRLVIGHSSESVGSQFGVSSLTVRRCTIKFCNVVLLQLKPLFLRWPNVNERVKVRREFQSCRSTSHRRLELIGFTTIFHNVCISAIFHGGLKLRRKSSSRWLQFSGEKRTSSAQKLLRAVKSSLPNNFPTFHLRAANFSYVARKS